MLTKERVKNLIVDEAKVEFDFRFLHIQKSTVHIVQCFFLTSDYLSSRNVSIQVLSAFEGLTTVFGMGTGGTPQLSSLDSFF